MGSRPSPGAHAATRRSAQVAALRDLGDRRPRREPLTVARIVAAALAVVGAEGYDALTMRRLAGELGVTQGALYAHVSDKRDLDDLMLAEVSSRVVVPEPEPGDAVARALALCRSLRDEYLALPGLARVALAQAPRNPQTLRLFEGVLAILAAGGAHLAPAAWTADAAFAYTAAYSVVSRRRGSTREDDVPERVEVLTRLTSLPPDLFPILTAHAEEVTSGEGHERFDFTLRLLFEGLLRTSAPGRG